MRRECAISVLTNLDFQSSVIGGLFVGFRDGVRNAEMVGWIEGFNEGESLVVSLKPVPLIRHENDWAVAGKTNFSIDTSSDFEQFVLCNGFERHFAMKDNHFSIYNQKALIDVGSSDSLQKYGDLLRRGFLITAS